MMIQQRWLLWCCQVWHQSFFFIPLWLRRSNWEQNPAILAATFLVGYLAAWAFFSLNATFLQSLGITWLCVSDADIFDKSNCRRRNIDLRRALSITAVKESCLQHCQNPSKYLTEKRRPGSKGAFITGVERGAFCLGYCGFIMALLFVRGIMNLYWICGLTLYVMLEKLIPARNFIHLGKIAASLLILAEAEIIPTKIQKNRLELL